VAATPARQLDTSKLSFGDMIAGASGLALFLFMFLPWFEAATSDDEEQEQLEEAADELGIDLVKNAWESFAFIDILLFLIAAAAVVYAIMRALDALPVLPVPPGLVIAGLGALALLLILFRIIVTPNLEIEAGGETVKVKDEDDGEINRKIIGLLLSLLAAGGIAFGGFTSAQERARGQFGGPGTAGGPLGAGAGPGAGAGGPAAGGPVTGGAGAPAAGGPAAGAPAAGGGAAQAAGQPKADWYPDPKGEARLRYWDGTQWTDQTAD
jgi:Protein of unknown function (DUF2510)